MQIPQELHYKNKVNGLWFLKVHEERNGSFILPFFIFIQNKYIMELNPPLFISQ